MERVVKQGVFTFDLNGEIHQASEVKDISEDILNRWKDEKLSTCSSYFPIDKLEIK
ncbi:hypothetical protein [Peribacillus simplex]|uniref:hypothetical protein n=1 Tax=Peribacillus simplex TaxID=1478 RepID=UPI003D2BDAA0